ncbi:putative leader peptide [Streptomyces sp. NPDC048417]
MESGVELVKRAHVDLLRVAASLCN